MDQTVITLFQCVCPEKIVDKDSWSTELNQEIKNHFTSCDYINRVRVLVTYLRKNGDNLYIYPVSELATMNIDKLAKDMYSPLVMN